VALFAINHQRAMQEVADAATATASAPMPALYDRLPAEIKSVEDVTPSYLNQGFHVDSGWQLLIMDSQGRHTFTIKDANGQEILTIPSDELQSAFNSRLSPDGQWIAYNNKMEGWRELFLHAVLGDHVSHTSDQLSIDALAWSPNSDRIAAVNTQPGSAGLMIFNINPLSLLNTIDTGYFGALDWSSHNVLAYVAIQPKSGKDRYRIKFYDYSSRQHHGELTLPFSIQNYNIEALRWSPDSSAILLSVKDITGNEDTQLYWLPMDQRRFESLKKVTHSGINHAPVWISNEKILYLDHSTPMIYELNTTNIYRATNIPSNLKNLDWVRKHE
jgi:Tol biopolymer transport system component